MSKVNTIKSKLCIASAGAQVQLNCEPLKFVCSRSHRTVAHKMPSLNCASPTTPSPSPTTPLQLTFSATRLIANSAFVTYARSLCVCMRLCDESVSVSRCACVDACLCTSLCVCACVPRPSTKRMPHVEKQIGVSVGVMHRPCYLQ